LAERYFVSYGADDLVQRQLDISAAVLLEPAHSPVLKERTGYYQKD